MMTFTALPTPIVRAFQDGQPDAYGATPERAISDGGGNPCRHCLRQVPKGEEMLILAYRPFPDLHPYAETGPIFLCADPCERGGGQALPDVLTTSPDYLIKGYCRNDRIVYGTGTIVEPSKMADRVKTIFDNPEISYIHVRSSRNNCYLARIEGPAKHPPA
ncbi:MAG: DUF1203 domain-containing protein [Rhodobacteraceae bacterium]|nr:DUF1203 domain-containing protein [Paracoccaceae bacterium]